MADTFETVEVPFVTIGNRQCLTEAQIERAPYLREFIDAFPACFEYDPILFVWWFYPEGD